MRERPQRPRSNSPVAAMVGHPIALKVLGAILPLVGLWLAFGFLSGRWSNPSGDHIVPTGPSPYASSPQHQQAPRQLPPQQSQPYASPNIPAVPQQDEAARAAVAEMEARLLSRSKRQAIKDNANQAIVVAEKLTAAIKDLDTFREGLPTNEDGRRIATDASLVQQYAVLVNGDQIDRGIAGRLMNLASDLIAMLDVANKTETGTWTPDKAATELTTLTMQAKTALASCQGMRTALAELVREGSANPLPAATRPSTQPGNTTNLARFAGMTLQQALFQLEAERVAVHASKKQGQIDAERTNREALELREQQALLQRETLAHNKEALALLSFCGLSGDGPRWSARAAAKAYLDQAYFDQIMNWQFSQRDRTGYHGQGADDLRALNAKAVGQFGKSLWELFRVACESETMQQRFATDEQLRAAQHQAQALGDRVLSDWYLELLASRQQLPKPRYK